MRTRSDRELKHRNNKILYRYKKYDLIQYDLKGAEVSVDVYQDLRFRPIKLYIVKL